jgi:hypothetical protein
VENHGLFTDVLAQKPRGFSDEINGFISITCKDDEFSNRGRTQDSHEFLKGNRKIRA